MALKLHSTSNKPTRQLLSFFLFMGAGIESPYFDSTSLNTTAATFEAFPRYVEPLFRPPSVARSLIYSSQKLRILYFGLESGADETLAEIKKGFTSEEVAQQAIKACRNTRKSITDPTCKRLITKKGVTCLATPR